jgi:hypothetical protein
VQQREDSEEENTRVVVGGGGKSFLLRCGGFLFHRAFTEGRERESRSEIVYF